MILYNPKKEKIVLKLGEKRTLQKFSLLPIKLSNGSIVWFEHYIVNQEVITCMKLNPNKARHVGKSKFGQLTWKTLNKEINEI